MATEKRVAVIQSNYLPWKGYFDIINSVDTFVFYDDVQYTKNDWRNRNVVKTPAGPRWITVPCGPDERRLICEVKLREHDWQHSHWDIIRGNYHRAPFYSYYEDFFAEVYLGREWESLSELNQTLIRRIAKDLLGVGTEFLDSRQYACEGRKVERLVDLLQKCGATTYLSGPTAKQYLSEDMLARAGIRLEWMDYSAYPAYPQLYPPFSHQVSIVDLLLMTGPDAPRYMLSFGSTAVPATAPRVAAVS